MREIDEARCLGQRHRQWQRVPGGLCVRNARGQNDNDDQRGQHEGFKQGIKRLEKRGNAALQTATLKALNRRNRPNLMGAAAGRAA